MSRKPKPKKAAKPRKPRAKKAPAAILTGGPKAGSVEISCLEACIRALDEACNAFGSIPVQRQDSELRGVINEYQARRAGVMVRLERVKQRNEE